MGDKDSGTKRSTKRRRAFAAVRRRVAASATGVAAASLVLVASVVAGFIRTEAAPVAAALDDNPCLVVDVPLWFINGASYDLDGNGIAQRLLSYSTGGTLQLNVELRDEDGDQLTKWLGDIAWSLDGTTLYAVPFAPYQVMDPELWAFDTTGRRTSVTPITGLPTGIETGLNGLSTAADGSLTVGSAFSNTIYSIDPDSGAATPFVTFPNTFTSAGDFVALPDGDVLAAMTDDIYDASRPTTLWRIAPDGALTTVGTVPPAYGVTLSGSNVYFAHGDGQYSFVPMASIPTATSTDPIPVTFYGPMSNGLWGATSRHESGCHASYEVSKSATVRGGAPTAAAGSIVDYAVTVTNTSDFAYVATAEASFSDDLSGVDSTVSYVSGSLTASSGTPSIAGSTLTWSGALGAAGTPGDTATITYSFEVPSGFVGSATITNAVTPTGFGGTCAPNRCAVSTDVVGAGVTTTTTTTSTAAPTTTTAPTPAAQATNSSPTTPAGFADPGAADAWSDPERVSERGGLRPLDDSDAAGSRNRRGTLAFTGSTPTLAGAAMCLIALGAIIIGLSPLRRRRLPRS